MWFAHVQNTYPRGYHKQTMDKQVSEIMDVPGHPSLSTSELAEQNCVEVLSKSIEPLPKTETAKATDSADSQSIVDNNSTENTHTLSQCNQEPVMNKTSSQSIQLLTTSLGMSMIAQLSSSEDSDDDTSSDDSVSLVVSDSEKNVQVVVEVCPKVKGEVDYRDIPIDGECKIPFPTDGKLLPIGEVAHYTEKLIVIKSFPNTPAVNEGTILWREDKTSVAPIFETFGPVKTPFYSILVDSKEHGSQLGLKTGDTVYVVPGDLNLTVYVFTSKLLEEKGCDASWKNDLEMPPEYQQFSDDEQESLKKKKNKKPGQKPTYTGGSSSQLSTTNLPQRTSNNVHVPRTYNRPLPSSRSSVAPPVVAPQVRAYPQTVPLPHFMGPPQPLLFPSPISHMVPPSLPPYPPPFGHPYPPPPPEYPHHWHQFPPPH